MFRSYKSREEILPLADQAIDEFNALGKTISGLLTPVAGPYAIFHHLGHAIERVRDLRAILSRLFAQRFRLTELAVHAQAAGFPPNEQTGLVSEELQAIFREEGEVTHLMKLDMECLYIFATVMLDQWAIVAGFVLGAPKASDLTMHELAKSLENRKPQQLEPLWGPLKSDILWLTHQIRYYRNRFIVHVDRPWQRGNTRSTFGDDFSLFVPSPPGWLDEQQIAVELADVTEQLGQRSTERATLESWFYRIDQIEPAALRERVASLVAKLGISTPTFQILGERAFRFALTGTQLLARQASVNPAAIVLGAARD